MIKKIKKLKYIGIFKDYSWERDLYEFKRYNLFYGWNGSGKTTLSKIFDSLNSGILKDFPSSEYEIETNEGNFKNGEEYPTKIRVFNKYYIDENIEIIKGRAKSIFILGAENKELLKKIDDNEVELRKLEKEKKDIEKDLSIKETLKSKSFTDIARTIGATAIGSAVRNYNSRNAKDDFDKLKNKELLNKNDLTENRIISKQEEKEKNKELDFIIDLDNEYNEIKKICNQTVKSIIIDRLKNNYDISLWVEQGLELHKKYETDTCEFCGNKIVENRTLELINHFNDADKELKQKIDNKIILLNNQLNYLKELKTVDKVSIYKELQTEYISRLSTFNNEKNNLELELNFLIKKLEEKKTKTTDNLDFNRVLSNNFLQSLKDLNKIIEEHNNKTDNFQTKKDEAFKKLKNHYLSEIFDEINIINDNLTDFINKKDEIQKGNSESKGIDKLIEEISQFKAKVSSEHKACDKLNKHLETFLGRKEIIFEVASEGGYLIKRNGKIAINLSEGEKTAITFIYFIVHLEDKNFKIKDGIIVIDDPISSLDSNSLFQAFSFLKNGIKDAKQIFLFTHNFDFFKLLNNWLSYYRDKTKKYLVKNKYDSLRERVAIITEIDNFLINYHTEYEYLFKLLFEFNNNNNENKTIEEVYYIPNIGRKVLETFLMFRVPNNKNLSAKIKILEDDNIFDSNKLTAINKFFNDQSHITGGGFDPSLVQEAEKNVKYLLEMIEKLFLEHYNILKDNCN